MTVFFVPSQRNPAEPSDQWLPAGAFDAGLEALAQPVRRLDGGARHLARGDLAELTAA